MLGPTRPVPRVGGPARVIHFGGGSERVTIVSVHDRGRRLQVADAAGERIEFVLSQATAKFLQAGRVGGARLELL